MSTEHCVCPEGYYIAICSTAVETSNPEHELEPAFALLGNIMQRFIKVSETFEPIGSGLEDNLFISRSFDATSHFESAIEDVLSLY